MKHALPVLLLPILLAACAGGGSDSDPQSAGESVTRKVNDFDARMAWWREARFGMFIHWGVYAVPAGTWNGRTTGGPSEWLMQSLKVPTSQYAGFADGFHAAEYDPEAWAGLAKRAGMKYVVITSRHHDGFCLWDSATTEWDVMASQARRDLLAPLAKATRDAGLKFCTYYSILDWRHPDYLPARPWNDKPEWNGGVGYVRDFDRGFVPYVHAQVEEVIRHLDPAVLWFDGEWEESWTAAHGRALYDKVRSLKPDIIVNNRVGKSRDDMAGLNKPGVEAQGDFCTPEQEVPATGLPGVDWETCMTMNDSWGYKVTDDRWKSSATIVQTLCDIASKGGNFLLNVGPTAAGRIPTESVERLESVGRWMDLNGSAIHGSHASPFKRLAWGRCTQTCSNSSGATTLNLFVFDWPVDGTLTLPGLRSTPVSARVVSTDKMLRRVAWSMTDRGVVLSNMGPRPASPSLDEGMPVLVTVALNGPAEVKAALIVAQPQSGGVYFLTAEDAEIEGSRLKLQGPTDQPNLGYWTSVTGKAVWAVVHPPEGTYDVELDLACTPSDAGNAYSVRVGNSAIFSTVPSTGDWATFRTIRLAGLEVGPGSGPTRVEVAPAGELKGGLMNLRAVRLIPR